MKKRKEKVESVSATHIVTLKIAGAYNSCRDGAAAVAGERVLRVNRTRDVPQGCDS